MARSGRLDFSRSAMSLEMSFSFSLSGDNGGYDRGLHIATDGTIRIHRGTSDTNLNLTVSFGSWNHLALVYGASSISLYKNGVLAWSQSSPASGWAEGTWRIGLNNYSGGTWPFKGTIDEVRIYSRALSPVEVSELYTFESDLPGITGQPQSRTVIQGDTVTFSVNTTAANALAYQWFKDGTALNGASNATLVITNVQIGHAGNYTVAVSNALVGAVSSPAALTVVVPIVNNAPGYVNSQFSFNLSGLAGSSFVLETSTNLQNWLPLVTNVFGTNVFPFSDPASPVNPLRFYRARY